MIILRRLVPIFIAMLLLACTEPQGDTMSSSEEENPGRLLQAGAWRGEIEIQGRKLPFQMDVAYPGSGADGKPRIEFINGEERVPVEEVHLGKDRVAFVLPAFNTRMDLRFKDEKLSGTLTKINTGEAEQKMPVTLTPGESHRFFEMHKPAKVDVSGRWRVMFREPDGGNYPAVAEFEQRGAEVTGTFLTPTSDYRYLAGAVQDNRLYLSAWDGFHVFLFEADIEDDGSLSGGFWSGPSWNETWTAERDANAELPDMDKQTSLREGAERFDFTFPDENGVELSLSDPRFRNKVVIVQLAGSWCPNCADETRFLAPWHRKNRERGIEVVALMFEHFGDFEKAAQQVKTWRRTYGVEYPTLIAGTSDKQEASAQLPQLNAFLAFPTTIFIAPNGEVARIQTGFNGPATKRFEAEIAKFNQTVDALLETRSTE